ncbi:MAG: tyrosine-protein phosphatase [Alphaproteobacteria bacterium]|jgi:protein tyrosine/serine phosphatase
MTLSRAAALLTRRTLLAALSASFVPTPGLSNAHRPTNWAVPLTISGIPNLHRVTQDLYRAAQPDADGFAQLPALGIRTVISLRQTVDDTSLAAATPLTLLRVPMKSRHVAEQGGARIVQALQLLYQSLASGPVLVHCHHGADRTGLICALYRMLSQGWTRDAALDELIHGGYGFHPIWANIPRYLQTVDLVVLKDRIAG